jgi:hypothetical protein
MSAQDSLLFIDANIYLDLYCMGSGKKLLALLAEQVNYIFVTQQIVNEVERNKLELAKTSLMKKVSLQTCNMPDHLFGIDESQDKDILQQMREIGQSVANLNNEIVSLASITVEQIAKSEDAVSVALAPIFSKAITHSPEELQRARDRKELGNPPGKKSDPIGDQLTWEQILTNLKGKKRLWIISRDADYWSIFGGKALLNCFLHKELCQIVSEPEVYLFTKALEGIKHFINETGVRADMHLTPEEVEEIELEEQSLSELIEVNRDGLQSLIRSTESGYPAMLQSISEAIKSAESGYPAMLRSISEAVKSAESGYPAMLQLRRSSQLFSQQALTQHSTLQSRLNAVVKPMDDRLNAIPGLNHTPLSDKQSLASPKKEKIRNPFGSSSQEQEENKADQPVKKRKRKKKPGE